MRAVRERARYHLTESPVFFVIVPNANCLAGTSVQSFAQVSKHSRNSLKSPVLLASERASCSLPRSPRTLLASSERSIRETFNDRVRLFPDAGNRGTATLERERENRPSLIAGAEKASCSPPCTAAAICQISLSGYSVLSVTCRGTRQLAACVCVQLEEKNRAGDAAR